MDFGERGCVEKGWERRIGIWEWEKGIGKRCFEEMELFGKEGVKGNLESRIGNSERENQRILLEQFDNWQCDTFDLVCGKLKMAEEDRIKIENKLKTFITCENKK